MLEGQDRDGAEGTGRADTELKEQEHPQLQPGALRTRVTPSSCALLPENISDSSPGKAGVRSWAGMCCQEQPPAARAHPGTTAGHGTSQGQIQEPKQSPLYTSHPPATRICSSSPIPARSFLPGELFDATGTGLSSRLEELSSESLSLSLGTAAGREDQGEERRETVIHNVHNTSQRGARWIQIKQEQTLTRCSRSPSPKEAIPAAPPYLQLPQHHVDSLFCII